MTIRSILQPHLRSPLFLPLAGKWGGEEGSEWPDETNTGPSGALLAVPGDVSSGTGWSHEGTYVQVNGNGALLENLDIDVSVVVQADNVTIRNCRITIGAADLAGVYCTDGASNVTCEDLEVVGPGGTDGIGKTGITLSADGLGSGFLVQRCDISGVENGISISAGGAEIYDNYIHDLIPYDIGGDPHIDGIQMFTDATNPCTIQGNNIIANLDGNSCITGADENTIINSNRLIGGGYTVYFRYDTTCQLTNNRFGAHTFDHWVDAGGGTGTPTVTGNVDDDTDEPITFP